MLKRTMAIKDSGHSIPGHGGFLDRFDSLIYSVPFISLLLTLY
ncbi:MAG: phosphatidate cytidylyltransferase, partial [Bacteroidota bacterium]